MIVTRFFEFFDRQCKLSIKEFFCFLLLSWQLSVISCSPKSEGESLLPLKYIDSVDINRERIGDIKVGVVRSTTDTDSLLMIFNKAEKTVGLVDPNSSLAVTPLPLSLPSSMIDDVFYRLIASYFDGEFLYVLSDTRILVFHGLFERFVKSVPFAHGFAAGFANFETDFKVAKGYTVLTALRNINYYDPEQRPIYLNNRLVTKLRFDEDSIRIAAHLPIEYPESQRTANIPIRLPTYTIFDANEESFAYTYSFWDTLVLSEVGVQSSIALPDAFANKAIPYTDERMVGDDEFFVVNGGNTNMVKLQNNLLLFQVIKSDSTLNKDGEQLTFIDAPKRMLAFDLASKQFKGFRMPPQCNPFLTTVFKNKLYLFSETEDFKTRMYAVDFE